MSQKMYQIQNYNNYWNTISPHEEKQRIKLFSEEEMEIEDLFAKDAAKIDNDYNGIKYFNHIALLRDFSDKFLDLIIKYLYKVKNPSHISVLIRSIGRKNSDTAVKTLIKYLYEVDSDQRIPKEFKEYFKWEITMVLSTIENTNFIEKYREICRTFTVFECECLLIYLTKNGINEAKERVINFYKDNKDDVNTIALFVSFAKDVDDPQLIPHLKEIESKKIKHWADSAREILAKRK